MGNFLFNLLGALPMGDPPPSGDNLGFSAVAQTTQKVASAIDIAITVFYAVIASLIVFYAIYVGWRLAKAEDDSQRKQAKAQLFYSIVGIIGVGIFIVLIIFVIPTVRPDVVKLENQKFGDTAGKTLDLASTIAAVNNILDVILKIIIALVGVFACYVAWQFIKAEDDSKRKQAKTQLIYCFVAIVGVALLALVSNVVFRLVFNDRVNGVTQTEGMFQLIQGFLA